MGLTARLRGVLDRHRFALVAFVGVMVVLLAVVIPARAQAVRTGDLQVSVRVTGAPAGLVRDYPLDYTCTDGQEGTVSARGSGAPTVVEGVFPMGTRCTVTAWSSRAPRAVGRRPRWSRSTTGRPAEGRPLTGDWPGTVVWAWKGAR